jgi:hypothetical protein
MGIDDDRTRNKYAALNAVLAAVHYTVSILVISSNSDEQFKARPPPLPPPTRPPALPTRATAAQPAAAAAAVVPQVPLVYGYTNWYPGEADAANCAAGCFTQEERITITQDLNIVLIIAFFGFISGTNHLIQLFGCMRTRKVDPKTKKELKPDDQKPLIEGWFSGYTVTVIRNVDYGFSASLMLITVAVLFLAPVDVQTLTYVSRCRRRRRRALLLMLLLLPPPPPPPRPAANALSDPDENDIPGRYVFCFQTLTQLAGCAAEVIRQLELENFKTRDGLPEFSLARPIFYSASAIYILPWSLLFYLFYVSGFRTPAPDSVPVGPVPAGAADLEPATPPLQVTFFLGTLPAPAPVPAWGAHKVTLTAPLRLALR